VDAPIFSSSSPSWLELATTKEELLNAAYVERVDYIQGQSTDVKVFSVGGGDVAMNGLHLNLAMFLDVSAGWRVFELANVTDYKMLGSTADGILKIELTRDTFDENDEIIQEISFLTVDIKNYEAGSISAMETKLRANGGQAPTEIITIPATTEEFLIAGASVDYIANIDHQNTGVKVFSISGGDPAMNGAHLNVAIFADVDAGWKVYELADVRDFKVLQSARAGFLKISLTRDTMDGDGEIKSAKSMLFLNIENGETGTILTEEVK
jgi:hypothetical protein